MKNNRYRSACQVACAVAALTAGCGDSGVSVSGVVKADGKPVDMGTISFSSTSMAGISDGAGIEGGAFQFGPQRRLPAGAYEVTLMAFRKTGRTINDPLRGPQPETQQLDVVDNPLTVEISSENASQVLLEFHTSGRP